MKILAYDLATSIGHAHGDSHLDEPPLFGTHVLPSTGEDVGSFLDAAFRFFRGQLTMIKPEVVVFEAPILPRETSLMTVRKLCSLAGMLEVSCKWYGVRCEEESLQTVKLFWAGKGNAKKEDMIAAAELYGFAVKNHDEADALGLWHLACQKLDPLNAGKNIASMGALGASARNTPG